MSVAEVQKRTNKSFLHPRSLTGKRYFISHLTAVGTSNVVLIQPVIYAFFLETKIS